MWAVSWRQGTRQRNSSVFQCSVWTAGFIRTPVSVSGCRENSVFNCVGHVWIKSVYACKMSGYVELRNCSVRPFASRLTNCVSACVFRQLISLEPRLSPITSQAGWLMSAGCINFFFFFFADPDWIAGRYFTLSLCQSSLNVSNWSHVPFSQLVRPVTAMNTKIIYWSILWISYAQGWWEIIFLLSFFLFVCCLKKIYTIHTIANWPEVSVFLTGLDGLLYYSARRNT